MRRLPSSFRIAFAVAALVAIALLSSSPAPAADKKNKDPDQIGNRNVGKGVNVYSIDREIALGKGLALQMERQAKLIDDPVIAEWVNRIGQNLVRNSDAKLPLTVKMIDAEQVNAVTLPGGFIFVNSGLLLNAHTEAEFAGALAHEIGHVAARHGTRQASRAEIAQLATLPLILMGGWAGVGARQGVDLAIPVAFLQFSQAFEGEADTLGLQYMYKAGYDPAAVVDFFERLQALEGKSPNAVNKFFSDHPPTGKRVVEFQKNIQMYLRERPQYVVNTSEFNEVKARLMALQNRRKLDPQQDPGKPVLRTKPGSGSASPENKGSPSPNDDDRPTIKRRPDTSPLAGFVYPGGASTRPTHVGL
jgi:beta-barrel assembly-enhancing protease